MREKFGLRHESVQDLVQKLIPSDRIEIDKLPEQIANAIASVIEHNNTKQLDTLRRLGVVPQGEPGWVEMPGVEVEA